MKPHVVILSTHEQDGNPKLWKQAIEMAGATAEIYRDCNQDLPHADLVIPHVLIRDYQLQRPVWTAALRYEAAGTPLLNSTTSLALSADKWLNYLVWADAGLPQSQTWRIEDLNEWPHEPVLVKPAFEESAHGVTVVTSFEQLHAVIARWDYPAVLQKIIPCTQVARIHATPTNVIGGYLRPAASVVGLPTPAQGETKIIVDDTLHNQATLAVRSLGAQLVGLDAIWTERGWIWLEANPPFALPAFKQDYMKQLAQAALNTIR